MLGKVFGFVLTMSLLDTHDYDERDVKREQMLREKSIKRKEAEFDEYMHNLVEKANKYCLNTSYT